MPTKNLHQKPFDETTLIKLGIFEQYAQAWIPAFVMSSFTEIYIFDFFAGPGYDIQGQEGSPIRILKKLQEQLNPIIERKVKVYLYFNEYDKQKKELLVENCNAYLDENKLLKKHLQLVIEQKEFVEAFQSQKALIKENPSLVYLDQNGVKFLKDDYFMEFAKMKQTDFLYFAASSYLKRFGNEPELQGILEDNTPIVNAKMHECHRILLEMLKKRIPPSSSLKLYPFSLKKSSNVYGIIFGASHLRAVDKFLSLAWKINPQNGSANFDIDADTQNA